MKYKFLQAPLGVSQAVTEIFSHVGKRNKFRMLIPPDPKYIF